ncbi:MAG: glycosyl hydrolase family 88, partial [Lachnospiraceae bacterium]|nr:glycosyl hydrolase family 88 [Lachnospiraceae bacterium]
MTALEKKNLESYALRLIRESTADRPVWNVEKLRSGEKASWNYIDGCMIISLLELWEVTGDQEFFDFAEDFVSRQIAEDGTIAGYEPEKY